MCQIFAKIMKMLIGMISSKAAKITMYIEYYETWKNWFNIHTYILSAKVTEIFNKQIVDNRGLKH